MKALYLSLSENIVKHRFTLLCFKAVKAPKLHRINRTLIFKTPIKSLCSNHRSAELLYRTLNCDFDHCLVRYMYTTLSTMKSYLLCLKTAEIYSIYVCFLITLVFIWKSAIEQSAKLRNKINIYSYVAAALF